MKRFDELVIVELAGSVAGSYTGKMFADLGAQVLKVEPPVGDCQRSQGEPLEGMGTLFAALNTSKESVALDLHIPTGAAILDRLLARADLVIESSAPGSLRPITRQDLPATGTAQALSLAPMEDRTDRGASHRSRLDFISLHPHLVRLYISPFGLDGPYAGYRSTSFTDYAAGGQMYLNGEPDREPIQGAGHQASYAAGVYGFIGALAALWAREQTGRGQTVDVSHMETMASLHQWTTVRWTHGHFIQRRVGNRYDSTHPITIYPCKDGYVAMSAAAEHQAQRLLAVAGLADLLDDPRFATGVARLQNADAFDAKLLPWLMANTVEDIVSITQAARIPVGPVPTMLELLNDSHLASRDFWQTVGGPESLRYPGRPFRLSRHAWKVRHAPALGSATSTVLTELGIMQPHALRQARITAGPTPETVGEAGPEPVGSDDRRTTNVARAGGRSSSPVSEALPLRGIRVLDLSRVWAGPLATRILGDLGADVIRVEAVGARGAKVVSEAVVQHSRRYPENEASARPWNREGMFNKFNRNKRAVTLQLDTEKGKAVFEALVRESDVVLENYSPRVMPQLGLGYERLRDLNPSIIYIGMPGFGWTGPNRDFVALGTMIEPAAGLSALMGYPDGGPYKSGVAWADPVAALNGAAAVLTALWDRAADPEGRGQAIELSQHEAMINFIGEELLAAQARGHDNPRPGNRHPFHGPQGVYPCAGADRWIAITVTNDTEWQALCDLAGLGPELADLRLDERIDRHDTLDTALKRWTAGQEHIQLMHRLQERGVPAFALLDARELVEDPHLAARGFFVSITHPDAGTYPFPGQPIHMSETPATFRLPAPGVGQHNHEVFTGILGMTEAELDALQAEGVIGDEPPG